MIQGFISRILCQSFWNCGKKQIQKNFWSFCYWNFQSAATGGVLRKKVFLKISQNSQGSTCARVFFLIKLEASDLVALVQVFSCKFCEIFKNTFFLRTPPVAASVFCIHNREYVKKKLTVSFSGGNGVALLPFWCFTFLNKILKVVVNNFRWMTIF